MKAYALAAAALTLIACQAPPSIVEAQAQPQGSAPLRTPDVIYVPTPHNTVEAMLALGEVKSGDVLYDLGSGDGRIPIAAAKKFGVRGVGIDINPERIAEANANAKTEGVAQLVQFRNEDLFTADFKDATVITLYLLPSLNVKLMPRLLELKPGTRIVSHAFDMGDWEPEKTVDVEDGGRIYLWRVPGKVGRD
ncbi:class I SAM-dependent methyltransferase [Phenylobacterium sp. SCN 70-31]|uniref:SAM-dependent methyltransferase n=1 Tax=Phenylobacterium sp. SCN 70-31 TaxID=1660129 RepID=UPI00086F2238|nr:class I SAM-dependent methyltransferase [Phenylobacterium sp. SCN 70-31]ODT88954.1 MAG: RNA methyltransferase [Phenylobacterium sp. SCN 70-31]